MNRGRDYKQIIKWMLIGLSLLLVVVFIYSAMIYKEIEENKKRGMPETEERVKQETDLTEIEKIESFNGAESYHVVYGVDKDEVKVILLVALNTEEDIITINQEEIISQEKIQEQWTKRCSKCKMIKITPGIVDEEIVWELTYRDEVGHYVLEYLSIIDGEQIERLRFTERFK